MFEYGENNKNALTNNNTIDTYASAGLDNKLALAKNNAILTRQQ